VGSPRDVNTGSIRRHGGGVIHRTRPELPGPHFVTVGVVLAYEGIATRRGSCRQSPLRLAHHVDGRTIGRDTEPLVIGGSPELAGPKLVAIRFVLLHKHIFGPRTAPSQSTARDSSHVDPGRIRSDGLDFIALRCSKL